MQKIAIIVPMKNMFDFKTEHYNFSGYDFVIIKNNIFINSVIKKYNNVLCSENCPVSPKFHIITGHNFYMDNLTYFVSKQFKMNNLSNSSTIAIVFDKYSEELNTFIIQISKIFKNIVFVPRNTDSCKLIAEQLFDNYGLYIQLKNINEIIECDMAVEVASSSVIYKNKPVIINIDSNISIPKEYNISIPYKVKKIALAEALYNAKQNIDNLM